MRTACGNVPERCGAQKKGADPKARPSLTLANSSLNRVRHAAPEAAAGEAEAAEPGTWRLPGSRCRPGRSASPEAAAAGAEAAEAAEALRRLHHRPGRQHRSDR